MTEFDRVYLDTAPIIYYLDRDINFGAVTKSIFHELLLADCKLITSTITCEEYLVHVYRSRNFNAETLFFRFLDDFDIDVLDVTREIAGKAAHIRAEYAALKAMDALQLSAASVSHCGLFLTNDKQLRQFREFKCVTLSGFFRL